MKKIYQIIFIALVLFLGQGNLVFGQVDIVDLQKALAGKTAICGLVKESSTHQADSTNQTVKDSTKTTQVNIRFACRSTASIKPNQSPLIVIDKEFLDYDFSSKNSINSVSSNDIQNITVFKQEEATALYGSKGINGVVIITTKKGEVKDEKLEEPTEENKIELQSYESLFSNPLYVIDAVPYSEVDEIMKNFSIDDIETINVLKGTAATALYGSRGINGVIIITTKKNKKTKEEKVETQVEEIALNVFPNPSSEFVTIDLNLKEESKVKITIHNLQTFESHTITEKKFEAGKQTIKYDLEKLEEGTYNIKIQIGKQVLHRKLVVKK